MNQANRTVKKVALKFAGRKVQLKEHGRQTAQQVSNKSFQQSTALSNISTSDNQTNQKNKKDTSSMTGSVGLLTTITIEKQKQFSDIQRK